MKKTITVQENGMKKEIQYDTSVESYENSPMVNMLSQFHSEEQPIVLSESLMALL